jgi:hypothetical protein
METWMLFAGAVAFTLLTMLLGPWMWSSSWTKWRMYRGADAQKPQPPRDARPEEPGAPRK